MDQEDLPDWLTEKYFEEILSEGGSTHVTVKKFKVKSAVPKGANYCGDILRVRIKYFDSEEADEKSKSLIVKKPKSGGMSDFITSMGLIQAEVDVYKTVIPKLAEIYGENVFTAKLYRFTEKGVFIFEDLNESGFKMGDRFRQLDFDHGVVALKAIARFHGASVKCHEVDPKLIEHFEDDRLINRKLRETIPQLITYYFQAIADEVANIPEISKYSKRFLEYKETCWDILLDIFTNKSRYFNVLNHGDCWTTNMLFKYDDEGKPVDVKLIDFQNPKYNSPAVDIIYFLMGSVQPDVAESRQEDLLSEYLAELNKTLERCGSARRLQADELRKEIDHFRFYRLFVTISLLPITLVHPNDVIGVEDMESGDFLSNMEGLFKNLYKAPLFKESLPKRLEALEKKGLF